MEENLNNQTNPDEEPEILDMDVRKNWTLIHVMAKHIGM